MPASKAVVV